MAMLKLAVRNLARNKKRTAITLVALVVGVGAMVGVRGFINGFRGMIVENQRQGIHGALQVHKAGYLANVQASPLTLDMPDSPAFRGKLAQVPGVAAVSPRLDFGSMLSTPDKKPPPEDGSELPEELKGTATFMMVTAFDPALEQAVTPNRWNWVKDGRGTMPASLDSPHLVLNDDFAKSLDVGLQPSNAPLPPIEQQLALLAGDRDQAMNGENVVLGGTFASVTPNDRRVGYVGLATAQRLLRMEGRVTEYALALAPGADLHTVRDALQAAVGKDYEVCTWEDRVPFLIDLVATMTKVFDIVSTIVLAVVLVGIINAMLMSVLERVREIGTMLAVGMRRAKVVQLFLLEGLSLGLVGGLVGTLLGVVLVLIMNKVGISLPAPGAKTPSIIHPYVESTFLLRSFAQATLGACLAAVIPARRAAQLRPVEALAHT